MCCDGFLVAGWMLWDSSVFKAIYQVLQAQVDQEGQTENPKEEGHKGVSNGEAYNQQNHW